MNSAHRELPSIEALAALPHAVCQDLRARLAAAGFDDKLVMDAERVAPRQFDAVRLPLVHAWLARRGGPSSTLAALFSYAGAVPVAEVCDALGADLTSELSRAGALEPAPGGALVSRYRLTPLGELFIFSDPPESGPDTVMGPGPTTMLLVDLIPENPGDVLDVGCGAGTLALVAAAHGARRAVGVDLSERAIRLSQFNARLNESAAVFRAGDLLEPVRGERFDLILSQPPYVVLPPGMASTTYLHGGPLGEELALRFAAAFPDALAEGGLALLHFDAPSLPGRPVVERLRRAMGTVPADVVVLTSPGPSADLEAAAFGALDDPGLGQPYRSAVRRYREHLAVSGIEAFTRVLAILRRTRSGASGFTAQLPAALERLTADDVPRFLAGLDLAGAPDATLLAARIHLAPGARLVLVAGLPPSETLTRTLRFEQGIPVDQEISEASRVLVDALATSDTVSEAVGSYARTCALPREAVQRQVLAAVREGLARGAYASIDARSA